jgi:hypothetical protein
MATAVFFVIVSLSFAVNAAEINNMKFSARVKVTVMADEDVKNTLSSYLNKELRSFNDVEVVYTNPDWEIEIIAHKITTGVIISTVTKRHFYNGLLSYYFQPKYKDDGLNATSDLYYDIDHFLNVGPSNSWERLCKDIVADFDTRHLEESRKSFLHMKESIQKNQK